MIGEYKTLVCKYCGLATVVKCGFYKGVPRYFCKNCLRKFKADNNPFHMKIPSEWVAKALTMYHDGFSLNKVSKEIKNLWGYHPSRSVVHHWVEKFTCKAVNHLDSYKPITGNHWVAGETVMTISSGRDLWLYDCWDTRTCYLLSSIASYSRQIKVIEELLKKAYFKAGKTPGLIMTYMPYSYFELVEQVFHCDVEHLSPEAFTSDENPHISECMTALRQGRDRVLRRLRSEVMVSLFVKGWQVHYNYFTKRKVLEDRAPAAAAGIDVVHSWLDICVLPEEGKPAIVTSNQSPQPV